MAIEWLQDRDSALKDQFVVDGEVFGSVRGPVGSGKGYYEWQFKNWVPTKGYVSGRSRTRTAAKNKLKAAYRLWAKGRQQNPSLTLHIPPRLAGKIKIRTNGKGIRVKRSRLRNPAEKTWGVKIQTPGSSRIRWLPKFSGRPRTFATRQEAADTASNLLYGDYSRGYTKAYAAKLPKMYWE